MNENGRKIVDKLIEIHGSTDFTIAFLPYKRSMWNSMESVFEECKASGIEVHCMPIPYYRMKENKQIDYIDSDFDLFGQIAEPIENLADIKPDYIAIHYQYEDHNRVTNMLPEYFTQALKDRYHVKVIFLPYGIYGTDKTFSLQPGCRHIDYAFVEDKTAEELFIAGWLTQGIDFNGRVFGLGSPKLDAVRDLRKEIPDEWRKQIPDIDARHITLLCNSLGPFLVDPVGRVGTYQHRITNEIGNGRVVIFRPHPLLRTTINSMIPGMRERYSRLISWMNTRDLVIVDESEYLERAIACADNLVSDPSSVVPMWRVTGKPWEVLP